MSESKVGKKNQERLPRELFRSWLRDRMNAATARLTRNSLTRLTTVESAVGSNTLIIKKILEHVGAVKDLLNCRLINSRWTSIATTRLIQLNEPSIHFNYHYMRNCYVKGNRQLSELVRCAKNSVHFPYTSFVFRAGDMCSEDAKEFLTTMGSSVKTLTFFAVPKGNFCGDMNLTDILSYTPKLETLVFSGGSYYTFTPANRLMLPALKSIKFTCHYTSDNIQLILSGAPVLENIVAAWKLDNVQPIVTTNKIHAVKRWCPSKCQFPSELIKLATATEGELLLSELSIAIHDDTMADEMADEHDSNGISTERLWQSYQKLLNANTIRKLILLCSKYPENNSFPLNMDNVNELILMPSSHPQTLRHFPFGINLNATFPQLKTLSFYDQLYHVCCAGSKWGNCFPLSDAVADFIGILPTVTTLNLRQESASVPMLRKLKKICPNVHNLELILFGDSDKVRIIKELFGDWRNLKELSIDLRFKKDNLKSLDSLFTGLSLEALKSFMFNASLTEHEKLRMAEDTRHVLWIGSISGLTKLNIKYEVPRYSQQTKEKLLIPFTEASGLYAFNLLPNLAVNLQCDTSYGFAEWEELKTALNSISPYATISPQQLTEPKKKLKTLC